MPAKVPVPYARTEFRGRPLDYATAAALRVVESVLGYQLTVVQGIGGAKASGGTHLEGRAVDLAAWDHERKVKALREAGFAAWYRPTVPGLWNEHIHAVLIFESRGNQRGVAPAGFAQIGKYDRLEDGLANPPTADPDPYRPDPRALFTLREYEAVMRGSLDEPQPTDVTRMRDSLVETIHSIGETIAFGREVDPEREVAKRVLVELKSIRKDLRAQLQRMPKR